MFPVTLTAAVTRFLGGRGRLQLKCENAFKVCAGVRLHSTYYAVIIYFPLNSLKGLSTALLNHFEYIEEQLKKKKDESRGVRYVKAGVDVAALTSHAMNKDLSFVDIQIACDLAEQLKPELKIIMNWIKKQLHLDDGQISDEGTNNVLRKIDDMKKAINDVKQSKAHGHVLVFAFAYILRD